MSEAPLHDYNINRVKRKLLCCLFLVCYYGASFSQLPSFDYLNIEKGLSQNSVLCITRDSRGFMWFGTRHGLNRYDGIHCRTYIEDNARGISDGYIMSLLTDSHNTFWAGTVNGLNKYLPEKDVFEPVKSIRIRKNGLNGANINCLYEDKKGTLWVGTERGLNQLLQRDSNTFRLFNANGGNGIGGNNVRTIFEDHEGVLWVGTNDGLTQINRTNHVFNFKTFRHIENKAGSLTDNFITAVAEDAAHNLWIGTQDGGVNFFNRETGLFSYVPMPGIASRNIRKIVKDSRGKLWIGMQDGVFILDPLTKTGIACQHDPANKKSLNQNSVYSIFEDNNGSVWIGTYFGGVNIAHPNTNSFSIWQNNGSLKGLSNDVVSGVSEDQDKNWWIATEGGGLNYLDRVTGNITVYKNDPADAQSLASNLVKTVYRDHDGNIWAGTHGGGVNVFDPIRKKFTRYLYKPNDSQTLFAEMPTILEDEQRRFWIGTGGDLQLYKRNNKTLEPYTGALIKGLPAKRSVKIIFEDAGKNIWVGTHLGMYVLKNKSSAFEHPDMLSTFNINCIQQDKKGNIWIGLYYGGLTMYDTATKKINSWSVKQGLPNNNIVSIQEDEKGYLWIGTSNGLSRLDVKSKTFQNYTTSDGLPGNEFNYNAAIRTNAGEMFFGGFNGLVRFFPKKITTNQFVAPVVFTGLKLYNSPVEINDQNGLLKKDISLSPKIVFHYNQDIFTIDFALLSFVKPSKNRYACKLQGLDKDWNETSSSSVTYTHLPEGNYTLLVKGANNDGVWSKPAALQLVVLPPLWKTWWAYGLYIILFAVLLFFLTRFFFLRELIKKEEMLHQYKLNFFTNISHEIRTHVALIAGPLEKLIVSVRNDNNISRQLLPLKKNTDRLLKLVNEQMDFRKAETGHLKLHVSQSNIVSFLREVYASIQPVALSARIKTSFDASSKDILLYFDREQLEKVFFNLLSNALKFTPNGGQVDVSVKENKESVQISITDNGKGIAAENLDKLFENYYQEDDRATQNTGYGIGLALAKSIVELHKGTLTVESSTSTNVWSDNETIFTVTLLRGKAHFQDVYFVNDTEINPLATAHISLPPVEKTNSATVSNPPAGAAKIWTVLLVEDNAEMRAFVRESLDDQYHIMEASNGLRGWESATENIPDLIVSDIMMPEMDGLTLCHQLKKDERTSHIPVILLTAKSSAEAQISGLETGADLYLPKPFSIRVLALHIQNLLALRESMRQQFRLQFKTEEKKSLPATPVRNNVDQQFLNKAIEIVEQYMDDPEFGVAMLSAKIAMSAPVLYKKLKAVTDMSVNDFIKSLRMQRALTLLQQQKTSADEIAFTVGYLDKKYFIKEFKKYFGKAPAEYER